MYSPWGGRMNFNKALVFSIMLSFFSASEIATSAPLYCKNNPPVVCHDVFEDGACYSSTAGSMLCNSSPGVYCSSGLYCCGTIPCSAR